MQCLATRARASRRLVGCVAFIGAPVGVFLGTWDRAPEAGRPEPTLGARDHRRGRGWRRRRAHLQPLDVRGRFLPADQRLRHVEHPRRQASLLHFAVACMIGCTFGMLFQADVRNAGSAMGWGMAYAHVLVVPRADRPFPDRRRQARRLVRMSGQAELFGPMVGHILFGLILGIVYSVRRRGLEAPLRRRRSAQPKTGQGPGVHLLLSLGWGSVAGLFGGIAAVPLMIQPGVLSKLPGLDSASGPTAGVVLHLVLSTAYRRHLRRPVPGRDVECRVWQPVGLGLRHDLVVRGAAYAAAAHADGRVRLEARGRGRPHAVPRRPPCLRPCDGKCLHGVRAPPHALALRRSPLGGAGGAPGAAGGDPGSRTLGVCPGARRAPAHPSVVSAGCPAAAPLPLQRLAARSWVSCCSQRPMMR